MTAGGRRRPGKTESSGLSGLPTVLDGRYEIVRRVGTGGMGDVYLARDTLLGRQVALKILHSQYARDQSSVERFRREARSAANLQHPSIVSIYDWGQDDNHHFIVMEFVEGRSLKDVIAADAPMDPKAAALIAMQVLSALDHAHRNGLVHRDIKPGNIMITSAGDARVTDFGIARTTTTDTMTQTGTILGTAYYLSPEQAQGMDVDGRSDLYSLGIVLYEMVCGKRPFEGESPVAVAYKHVREQPRPPSTVRSGIPSPLESIIMHTIAKQPDSRYQSASEMRGDLQAFVEGRQVTAVLQAPEPSEDTAVMTMVGGPVRRPATRRPGWLLALALALLVGGLSLGAWSLVTLLRPMIGGAEVPALQGMSPEDAEVQLRARGLTPSFQANEPHSTVEEGLITRQLPDPGQRITQGSPVRYWVSSGLPFVAVPDVRNTAAADAQRELSRLGLVIGEQSTEFNPAPAGTVIGQNPRAGTQVRQTTPVDLVVSRGPETGVVPNVIGETEVEAARILTDAGFRFERIEGFSDDHPDGRVFDQEPAAGGQAETGITVTIWVSRGAQTFAMPDVRGRTEAAAREHLEGLNLDVRTVMVFAQPDQRGRVVDQFPQPNRPVRRGDVVEIHVGTTP